MVFSKALKQYKLVRSTYSRVPNNRPGTIINFGGKFEQCHSNETNAKIQVLHLYVGTLECLINVPGRLLILGEFSLKRRLFLLHKLLNKKRPGDPVL